MKELKMMNWDCDDARFCPYNHVVVTSTKEWEVRVKGWAISNKEELIQRYRDDGGEEDFECFLDWVEWCIDNFVSADPIRIDNYILGYPFDPEW